MMYIKKLLGTEFLSILVDLPRQYPSVMRKNQQFSTFLQRSILRLFVRTAKKGRDENQLQTKLSILRLSALIVLPSGIRKLPAAQHVCHAYSDEKALSKNSSSSCTVSRNLCLQSSFSSIVI
jgi:hypothetical protein